jgi:hypothetical protein
VEGKSMGSDKASAANHHDPDAEDQLGLFKEYLSEPRFRIKLDDLVNASVRATLLRTSGDTFPLDTGRVSGEDFAARLKSYEEVVGPLQSKAVLMGKWATPEQRSTLTNMLARMSDNCAASTGGTTLWLGLRWYPISLLLYSAGIAALSAENYPAFAAIHTKKIDARARAGSTAAEIVVPVVEATFDVANTNAWKLLADYKQKRTPESEHLFKVLQPVLDDLLFLGAGYEHLFDRYEMLRALIYADITDGGWGPVGRFGWKYSARRGQQDNPYTALRAEVAQLRDQWGPLKAGLFRGSYTRFEQTAAKFESELLGKLNWY